MLLTRRKRIPKPAQSPSCSLSLPPITMGFICLSQAAGLKLHLSSAEIWISRHRTLRCRLSQAVQIISPEPAVTVTESFFLRKNRETTQELGRWLRARSLGASRRTCVGSRRPGEKPDKEREPAKHSPGRLGNPWSLLARMSLTKLVSAS